MLLVFGIAVYGITSLGLINQVDNTLAATARQIMSVISVDESGSVSAVTLPALDFTANTYVQVWGRDGKLKTSSHSIAATHDSLDPAGLISSVPVYRDALVQGIHLRVLSIPLALGNHPIAVLQVAASLTVEDAARANLLYVMLIAAVAAAGLSAVGSWVVLGRSLAPLATVADAVEAINRADDLDRRIPVHGRPGNEISELINSVNQTLERLENLFASQQRLLADVSHELRTPLTVIKGNAELMRRMKALDEESLSSIETETGRLTRLVGSILLLAQAESGRLKIDRKPVDLDTLMLEVVQEMRVAAGEKVRIRVAGIDQLVINGERDRIKQVLLNVVANAVKYTPGAGEVVLDLARSGVQARLTVRDSGPGISPEDLPHIFDRFYRAERSRTRSGHTGFGLGLSIAQWIVEAHGGSIQVESTLGEGTTFAIYLPLAAVSNLSE